MYWGLGKGFILNILLFLIFLPLSQAFDMARSGFIATLLLTTHVSTIGINPIFLTGKVCTRSLPGVDYDDEGFTEAYSSQSFTVDLKGYRLSSKQGGTTLQNPLGIALVLNSTMPYDILTALALSGSGDPIGRFITETADLSSAYTSCLDEPSDPPLSQISLQCDQFKVSTGRSEELQMLYLRKSEEMSSVVVFWNPTQDDGEFNSSEVRFHFLAINTTTRRFWSGIQSPVLTRNADFHDQQLLPDDTELNNFEIECQHLSTAYEVRSGEATGRSSGVLSPRLYALIFSEPLRQFSVGQTAYNNAFSQCFKIHGCIVLQDSNRTCAAGTNCMTLITHRRTSNGAGGGEGFIKIQIFSDLPPSGTAQQGYTAIGFSFDSLMGEDVAIQCLIDSNGTAQVYFSWNLPSQKNNVRIDPLVCTSNSYILSQCMVGLEGNRIGCEFNILDNFIFRGRRFDFAYESYFILSASGRSLGTDNILKHDVAYSTEEKQSLTIISEQPELKLYVKIHGVLMMLVWMVFVPNAIFFSRYFKETWANRHFLGRRMYFTFHVSFNLTGFCVMILSNMYILYVTFAKRRRWSEVEQVQFHMKTGGTACLLYLVQVASGWVQPIDEVSRRIFSLGHWTVGTTAVFLSFVTLLYSPTMPNQEIPCLLSLGVWVWFAWTVLFHIIMGLHFRWIDTTLGRFSKRGFSPLPMMNVTYESAPGTRKRIGIWLGYFFGSLIITGGCSALLFYLNNTCRCSREDCLFSVLSWF